MDQTVHLCTVEQLYTALPAVQNKWKDCLLYAFGGVAFSPLYQTCTEPWCPKRGLSCTETSVYYYTPTRYHVIIFFPVYVSSFDGRVVAKLPFTPLSYIQGLSHRNLLGEDFTDCSFIFLYILCTMSIRQVIHPDCLKKNAALVTSFNWKLLA